MNWQHLSAFIWLRWRLMVNQARRAGALSAAITIIASISIVSTSVPLLLGCFFLGTDLIPKASPAQLMYVWDGLILIFCFFWCILLIAELQRNDPLSLSKFLHLPVSVRAAFLINYLSSLARLSLVLFVPAMVGYALALISVKGVEQLMILPAVPAFVLMITAPTYQFQGWLASLVSNPRRRRNVMVATTIGFVMLFQIPNVANMYFMPKLAEENAARSAAQNQEMAKLENALKAGEISLDDYSTRQTALFERFQKERQKASLEAGQRIEHYARIANMALPIGWLAIVASSAAEGRFLVAFLGLAGMALIGSASLLLSYRSTLRQFHGASSNQSRKAPATRETVALPTRGNLLEVELPGCSEPVSVVALGTIRSLLRSPEAKLSLLSPLILGVVFGTILLRSGHNLSPSFRPLLGVAAMAMVNFGLMQLMSNQFGLDRDGFRVFVLCSAPRRDILLGKNLALLPFALFLSVLYSITLLVLSPMSFEHAISMIPQFVTMFVLFAVMANLFSICLPVFMAPGTLKPANPKLSTVLLQLVLFLILFPITQGIALLPLGIEAVLRYFRIGEGLPICFLLAIAECSVALVFYYASLGWLGRLLQGRETKILETVINRTL